MRRFERVPVEMTVFVSTPSHAGAAEAIRSLELGEGGCLLEGREFFGVGRILTLDLMLSHRPVRAIAKVLYEYRTGDGGVCSGVEFQFLSEDSAQRLQLFLDERLRSERIASA